MAISAGLFSGKSARIRRLRQLIVDLEPPVTGRAADGAAAALPAPADGDSSDNLNDEQRRAVDRSASCLVLACVMISLFDQRLCMQCMGQLVYSRAAASCCVPLGLLFALGV